MKIGLSNIAILIALEKFNARMAIEAVLIKFFTQALMLELLFTGFIISFTAGTISISVTILIYRYRKYLSLLAKLVVSQLLYII